MDHNRRSDPDYLPIAAYALIGDCHTAALVANTGSIDWYCPGRFDAPAVFCRILDAGKGGYFRLAPGGVLSVSRRYAGDTNILQTIFRTVSGEVMITDLMPVYVRQPPHAGYDVGSRRQILRLVEVLSGQAEVELALWPTFDYARRQAQWSPERDGAIAHSGDLYLACYCPAMRAQVDAAGVYRGRARLAAGERRWVALTCADDMNTARAALQPEDFDLRLQETRTYWLGWAAQCTEHAPYQEAVLRSALVLKLLTYEPTGALIAAPTTSLPEEIGGVRNWDYRFTWLRDSALILSALLTVGHSGEARDFFRWLVLVEQAHPARDLQIMYTIDGDPDLPEIELDHLAGYRDSQPVRIGNGAAKQRQLDIYGELLTAAYVYYETGSTDGDSSTPERPDKPMWDLLRSLVDEAAEHWQEPDKSIWEVRGGPQRFVYSQLMCWAALDRGLRMAEAYGLPAPVEKWQSTRAAIRETILSEGYDPELGAFTQALGSPNLDASMLIIPMIGFLPPKDARVQSTINQIQSQLTQDGQVYRYLADDGLPGGEATFTLCTFWLVSALALSGRLDEARTLFERTIEYANDVGLLSEELDPVEPLLLGNFPQGFTHLALITAAADIANAQRHGAGEHAVTEADRTYRATHPEE